MLHRRMRFCSIFKILPQKGGIKLQLTEDALHKWLHQYTVFPVFYAVRRHVNAEKPRANELFPAFKQLVSHRETIGFAPGNQRFVGRKLKAGLFHPYSYPTCPEICNGGILSL